METNDNNEEDFFPEYYDYEDIMDEKIAPLMKTIINTCNEYAIPMVCSFQYRNTEDDIELCTSVVVPSVRTSPRIAIAADILLNVNRKIEDEE